VWHPSATGYYYGIFWSGMPDLNLANPEVRAEIFSIADFWLGLGIDGFRLDAARHLFANGDGELQNDQPETHGFWKEFSRHVREVAPDALLVGENWTSLEGVARYFGSTERVAGGDELPMSFDFQLAGSILEATRDRTSAPVLATLEELAAAYPPGVLDGTFLTNHDQPRVATQLGGDEAMLRTAAALLLTLPGTPFVYYGEELGMTGAKPDPDIRTPMQWSAGPGAGFTSGTPWRPPNAGSASHNVAAERSDPDSLLSWYRALIHLRESQPALARGDFEPLDVPDEMLGFVRRFGDDRVVVLHNLGLEPAATGPLAFDPADPILLSSAGDGLKVGGVPDATLVVLPPGATVVFGAR
jgi:glycosidase